MADLKSRFHSLLEELSKIILDLIWKIISLTFSKEDGSVTVVSSELLSLPENMISKIISLTSPKDACRAAAVSSALKSATESDIVWEQFLPPEYEEIISPVTFSEKELYFKLCDSHLILRGGKMNIKLEKVNGKKAYTLPPRELDVALIDNPTHWRWISLLESRFGEVAELLTVSWLDIRATLGSQILTPDTNYAAYLVYKLSEDHHGLQWPSVASVTFRCSTEYEGEITDTTKVSIAPPRFTTRHMIPSLLRWKRTASYREDGWMEICLGEFFVGGGNVNGDVGIHVCETENLHSKKGLMVEGIEVRPKEPLRFLNLRGRRG